MIKAKAIAMSILLLVTSGCATSPVRYSKSDPVPQSRIYAAYEKYSVADDTQAKLTFIRDGGMLGAAGSLALYVNGDLVARVRTAESISVYLAAGSNELAVGPGGGGGPVGAGVTEHTLVAVGGEEYYYRLGLDTSVGLVIRESVSGD